MKLDATTAAVVLVIAGLVGMAFKVEHAGWAFAIGLIGYIGS